MKHFILITIFVISQNLLANQCPQIKSGHYECLSQYRVYEKDSWQDYETMEFDVQFQNNPKPKLVVTELDQNAQIELKLDKKIYDDPELGYFMSECINGAIFGYELDDDPPTEASTVLKAYINAKGQVIIEVTTDPTQNFHDELYTCTKK